ncbi:MAG: hypothetical protein GY894_11000 [Planctomycetes bacterium]|nr:hypothetical protein [Planctomycetota bacterium]
MFSSLLTAEDHLGDSESLAADLPIVKTTCNPFVSRRGPVRGSTRCTWRSFPPLGIIALWGGIGPFALTLVNRHVPILVGGVDTGSQCWMWLALIERCGVPNLSMNLSRSGYLGDL